VHIPLPAKAFSFGWAAMTEARIIHLNIVRPSTRKNRIPGAVRLMLKSALFTTIGGRDAGKEVVVAKAGLILVAIGVVSAVALWSKSSAVNGLPVAQSISIRELHMLANPGSLPIQQVDDQSVIYEPSTQQQN
jgi:hypothetical protein